jgi:hypothetical protein
MNEQLVYYHVGLAIAFLFLIVAGISLVKIRNVIVLEGAEVSLCTSREV